MSDKKNGFDKLTASKNLSKLKKLCVARAGGDAKAGAALYADLRPKLEELKPETQAQLLAAMGRAVASLKENNLFPAPAPTVAQVDKITASIISAAA